MLILVSAYNSSLQIILQLLLHQNVDHWDTKYLSHLNLIPQWLEKLLKEVKYWLSEKFVDLTVFNEISKFVYIDLFII